MNINTKFQGFEQSNSNITGLNSCNVNDELTIVGKRHIKFNWFFMVSVIVTRGLVLDFSKLQNSLKTSQVLTPKNTSVPIRCQIIVKLVDSWRTEKYQCFAMQLHCSLQISHHIYFWHRWHRGGRCSVAKCFWVGKIHLEDPSSNPYHQSLQHRQLALRL